MGTFANYSDTNIDDSVLKKLESIKYVHKNGLHVKWSVSQCDVELTHYVTLTGSTSDTPVDRTNWHPIVDKSKNVHWQTRLPLKWFVEQQPYLTFMCCMDYFLDDCLRRNRESSDYVSAVSQLALAVFHAVCEEKYVVSCGCHMMDVHEFLRNWGYNDSYNTTRKVTHKIGNAIQDYLNSKSIQAKLLAIIDHNCEPKKPIQPEDFEIKAKKATEIKDDDVIGLLGWKKRDIERTVATVGCTATSCMDDMIADMNQLFHSPDVQFDIQVIIANACEELDIQIENPILDNNGKALSPFDKKDFITMQDKLRENRENIEPVKTNLTLNKKNKDDREL